MTTTKDPFVRRSSLFPPQERVDSPNAHVVDASSVIKSLTHHPRQHDQETANAQEQQTCLAQQRLSLISAMKTAETLAQRNSIVPSADEQRTKDRIKRSKHTKNNKPRVGS